MTMLTAASADCGNVWAARGAAIRVRRCQYARGENRTLTPLPGQDFKDATYGDDRGIAGSYGHFRGAVLPGGSPSRR